MMHRVCWACWIGGAAAIALSRFDLVPPDVGWAGFYAASIAAVLSYLPQRAQTANNSEEWAVLTKAMLESKDRGYEAAMATFQKGRTVLCDGLAFAIRSGKELGLTTIASLPAAEMDDLHARQDAERAATCFEAIARSSPEVAARASERTIGVSLLSEYGTNGVEICRVTDGQVEWKIKR